MAAPAHPSALVSVWLRPVPGAQFAVPLSFRFLSFVTSLAVMTLSDTRLRGDALESIGIITACVCSISLT